MRLNELKGYFGVREYNAKKQRSEWKIKGNDENITFDVTFSPEYLPAELATIARQYENKNGETKFAVRFKIGANAKWFTHAGKIERPANADLDGKRFSAWIECNILNGDPTKKEASGAWVNGILIKEDDGGMFDDLISAAIEADAPVVEHNDDDLEF